MKKKLIKKKKSKKCFGLTRQTRDLCHENLITKLKKLLK
jgi:hypothetical protein